MSLTADALYKMSEVELLAAYVEARRQFVEKKFARDTHRARLEWIRAKMFVGSSGGVTERNMAIDVSEEIARKGQELREMTRDLFHLERFDAVLRFDFRQVLGFARGGQDAPAAGFQHRCRCQPDAGRAP